MHDQIQAGAGGLHASMQSVISWISYKAIDYGLLIF